MKKQVAIYIGIVVVLIGLIAGGFYLYQSNTKKSEPTPVAVETTPSATWENNILTYNGKDGVTAEDLAKQSATITKDQYGMVASINGIASTGNQYWQFNINGVSSSEGAGSYITKSNETITWKLSSL
ncbi:MAG: DUF4430 domain-containing protein [Candidatus Saccharibacteria bacterium]